MSRVPIGGEWLSREAREIPRDAVPEEQDEPVPVIRVPMVRLLNAESLAAVAHALRCDVAAVVERYS